MSKADLIKNEGMTEIVKEIKDILSTARSNVARQVNNELLQTYWNIGRVICKYEQSDIERADYGRQTLKALSKEFTQEFGKDFSQSNLYNMHLFYQTHKIFQAVSGKLSWSH